MELIEIFVTVRLTLRFHYTMNHPKLDLAFE
jgi:hypothetical protein